MSNKTTYSVLFFLVFCLTLTAQELHGTAVYTSKTNTVDISSGIQSNKNITPEMKKKIEEKMKTIFDKSFILNFNKTASTYKLDEKSETPGRQGGNTMRMATAILDGGTLYKNTKSKTFAVDKKLMEKEYLVKDALADLQWKTENETKMISGYTCYKATATRKPGVTDFRHFKPKRTADQPTEANKSGHYSIIDNVDIPKEINVTAWYTKDIPTQNGPENYWGLPGLILEVNDGKTTISCVKVTLNTKDKVVIKAPTNGTPITQKQYEAMLLEKLNELQQNYINKGAIQK